MSFTDKLKEFANNVIETTATLGSKAIEEIKKIDFIEVLDNLKEKTDEHKKKFEKLEKFSDKELFDLIKKKNSDSNVAERILLSRGYNQEQIKTRFVEEILESARELEEIKNKI